MLVHQIAVNNPLRNYMYLIVCPDTNEAAAIDPLDHSRVLEAAEQNGWSITAVINTHEHHDHIDGNEPVIEETEARLYAHHQAMNMIPGVDVGLYAGDEIKIGRSVVLKALDTPGHTFCHTCLLFEGNDHHPEPALFCGDTLFNAGVGNCHNGGDPAVLYRTFAEQLFLLDDRTKVYPGHDYIANNLQFTLDREPDNQAAASLLIAIEQWPDEPHFVSNLALERVVNSFFRLESASIRRRLADEYADFDIKGTDEAVFLKLRELRNHW